MRWRPWWNSWRACGHRAGRRLVRWPSPPTRTSHESHARRLSALVAVRPLAPGRAGPGRRPVPARLAGPAPAEPAAVARRPAERLFGGAGGRLPGPGVADRAVRRAPVASPHDPALA